MPMRAICQKQAGGALECRSTKYRPKSRERDPNTIKPPPSSTIPSANDPSVHDDPKLSFCDRKNTGRKLRNSSVQHLSQNVGGAAVRVSMFLKDGHGEKIVGGAGVRVVGGAVPCDLHAVGGYGAHARADGVVFRYP